MPEDRRLAAIMFTDIVGYTALMGSDEDKAFNLLKRNQEIHRKCIDEFNGTLIKEIGDGTLASFPLASEAVRCAMEIQKTCREQGIPLKIGIHEGEMVFAGTDVLGDGVNIASRLQESAEEGCISISGSVYRDIKNKAGIKTELIGEKSFKNVDEPIKVYKVVFGEEPKSEDTTRATPNSRLVYYLLGAIIIMLAIVMIWQFLPSKETPQSLGIAETVAVDKSIAVLPFADMSPARDQEYFCDGMMDEILMHLFKIGDLRVTARTSVMGYKNTDKKVREIARELGVAHILEGSIRKSENRIRITVQLIDTAYEQHLWAESYDRELADVFSIQSEVAQKIASALKATISREVQERIEANPTTNLEAYDYYLKGNEAYWGSWGHLDKEMMYNAVDYFKKAIEIDPEFSLAYTGLGRSYWWLADMETASLKPELMNNSKSSLKKAIELDPYNGWAYAEMSVVSINWDWDSAATRYNQEMAKKLMPNDYNAYIHSFYFESRLGNCEEMESIQKEYKRFNQYVDHPFNQWSLIILFCQKNYSEIARRADQYWIDRLRPHQIFPIFFSYILSDEFDKADKMVRYVKDSINNKFIYFWYNGILKAKLGEKEAALIMCDSLKTASNQNGTTAFIYAALQEKKPMYYYLNKAIDQRESLHFYINYLPEFISCEDDEEFQRITREIWIPRE